VVSIINKINSSFLETNLKSKLLIANTYVANLDSNLETTLDINSFFSL